MPSFRTSLRLVQAAALLGASVSLASGLDRDSLLSEAPATPNAGNVRITGGGVGATATSAEAGSANVSATVQWTPLHHLAADVGGYLETGGAFGPTARVRYQLLEQETQGIDLAVGLRYKARGFNVNPAATTSEGEPHELEFLVAGGHSFGRMDLVLNAVVGTELGGPGKDAELKAFLGYRLSDALRLGVDSRLQAEFYDEEGGKVPEFASDMALAAGPAVAWMITDRVELQALVGVVKARGVAPVGPGGQLLLSVDF